MEPLFYYHPENQTKVVLKEWWPLVRGLWTWQYKGKVLRTRVLSQQVFCWTRRGAQLMHWSINLYTCVSYSQENRVSSQERQPATLLELPNNQIHQSPNQSYAENHTEQTETTSGKDHRWRTGRLQSRKKHHKEDLQPTNPLWEISSAPTKPLPSLHRLQKDLRQGLAWSFVGNKEEVH